MSFVMKSQVCIILILLSLDLLSSTYVFGFLLNRIATRHLYQLLRIDTYTIEPSLTCLFSTTTQSYLLSSQRLRQTNRIVGTSWNQNILSRRTKSVPTRGCATTAAEIHVDENSISSSKSYNQLTREFFRIAVPAFCQLTAEPLASLVDTAYLGRLGPEVLGGAGVAISAQYAVSKLYNDPLLRTSISLVASQDGKHRRSPSLPSAPSTSTEIDPDERDQNSIQLQNEITVQNKNQKKELSIAVSSALLLALTVGIVQLFVYTTFASMILNGMGLTSSSSMWYSALSYLRVRALGTPAATLWLVTNGIFRGLGDTQTPFVYSLAFTLMNAIFDPIFIFTLHYGAAGAAAGTAVAQYIALIPLLFALHRRVPIDIIGNIRQLSHSLREYLEAGGYVLFRSMGKVLAYSVCAREAALLGTIAAAAYNLTFQLGFATTQICESVAIAVQTLLAREMADSSSYFYDEKGGKISRSRSKIVQHLIRLSMAIGGSVAIILSLLTFYQRNSVMQSLTSNIAVQQASIAIFPAVLLTQVLKGFAYPVNGIIMGGLDWKFTTFAMWLSNIFCISMIKFGGIVTLNKIWLALGVFMGTQVITGIIRFQSKTGIWKLMKEI